MRKVLTSLLAGIIVATSLATLVACKDETPATDSANSSEASETPAETPAEASETPAEESSTATNNTEVTNVNNPIATIELENGKKIVVELMPEYAPESVNNFITLANSGFYDGVIFHRIVPGFVIQGGDPDGTGMGGPGYAIKGEFAENGFTANTLSHNRGVISMARTMIPDSAGSQFFIVLDDMAIPSLDNKYAGFGSVIEGMDVVDEIAAVQRDQMDKPLEPVVMKTVTVDTKGVSYPEPEKLPE